jgi:hypothetical protein
MAKGSVDSTTDNGPPITENENDLESGVKPGEEAEMTKLKVPVTGGVPLKIPVFGSKVMPGRETGLPQVTPEPGIDVSV